MQLSSLIVFCLTLNAFIIYIFKSVLWLCPITFTHAILAPHHHLMSSFICYDESTLGTCISSSCSATKLKPSPLDRAHKTTYGTFTFHFYPQGTRGPIKSRYGILSGNFWKWWRVHCICHFSKIKRPNCESSLFIERFEFTTCQQCLL